MLVKKNMAASSYMTVTENKSFSQPERLIVITMDPMNSGVSMPLTLPMNASSEFFRIKATFRNGKSTMPFAGFCI